jgi:hypothetical protein
VDATGSAWVSGRTDSFDFPTRRPLRAAKEGVTGVDGFLARISPDGDELLFPAISAAATTINATPSLWIARATYMSPARPFPTISR